MCNRTISMYLILMYLISYNIIKFILSLLIGKFYIIVTKVYFIIVNRKILYYHYVFLSLWKLYFLSLLSWVETTFLLGRNDFFISLLVETTLVETDRGLGRNDFWVETTGSLWYVLWVYSDIAYWRVQFKNNEVQFNKSRDDLECSYFSLKSHILLLKYGKSN